MMVILNQDPNTLKFAVGSDGKVTACPVKVLRAEDSWTKWPGNTLKPGMSVYRAKTVRFMDEDQSGGKHIIYVRVFGKDGQPQQARVLNAWPSDGVLKQSVYEPAMFHGSFSPWYNTVETLEFAMGPCDFDPNKTQFGPLVITVVDNGSGQQVASDYLAGFGMPGNRHVCYVVELQEDVVGSNPTAPDDPGQKDGCLLAVMKAAIKAMEKR